MFNLLDNLKHYKGFDIQEIEDVKKVINFLEKNKSKSFDRKNLQGHITAGALVCDDTGNILLNYHKFSKMWIQFGGHSDCEENSFNVAKREVFEECGIKDFKYCTDKIFDVSVQPVECNKEKNEPKHFHYDINFLFITSNHNFKISKESLDIKWVTINEAKALVKSDKVVKRMIEKYEFLLNANYFN